MQLIYDRVRVCKKHFSEDCFSNRRTLNFKAVPTLFLPSQFQQGNIQSFISIIKIKLFICIVLVIFIFDFIVPSEIQISTSDEPVAHEQSLSKLDDELVVEEVPSKIQKLDETVRAVEATSSTSTRCEGKCKIQSIYLMILQNCKDQKFLKDLCLF